MRRPQRLIAATVLTAIAVALAGCSSGNFDPTDMMDWFDTKKKIPGERRPVFPEGVPGVEQGVPKDMYKGSSRQEPSPVVEAPPPASEPARKPAARSAAARDAEPFPKPIDENKPPPIKRKRTRITAPEPDAEPAAAPQRQQQQSAPPPQQQAAPQQQAPSSFPAPLPSGGFAR